MVNAMDCWSSFDYNIAIKKRLMKDNMTFCPALLEKFEYLRTNGQSKAGISNLETPARHYIRMRARAICSATV